MAGAKKIRDTINSIKKTKKITKAMEMVAASKMRKTQERMRASKPYATKIYDVISHIARSSSEYKHPFMTSRDEVSSIGVIVVTSDRGLCGGLNSNLLRELVKYTKKIAEEGKNIKYAIFGKKGKAFFKRLGGKILASTEDLGDQPAIADLIGTVKVMLDAYNQKEIDQLFIISNEFINTMTQKPVIKQLLPLPKIEQDSEKLAHYWDYIYEPEARYLLDHLFDRYIELQTYQAVVENIACEQAAKMIAMKNATDNAGELIKLFQLAYNKARQAAITQELSEIVGGASA